MENTFHEKSVCQGKKRDRVGQADCPAKPNSADLSNVIHKALKSQSLHCPGCKKKHISEFTVGAVGFWVGDGEPCFEYRGYSICRRCVNKYGSPTFVRRIERRLRKEPGLYGIDLLPLSVAKKTGINPSVLVKGGNCRTDPWVQDDRKWFKGHPDRSHRIRRLFSESETDCFEQTDGGPYRGKRLVCVAVQQIEPGSRIRIPVYFDENTTDAEAGTIIDGMNASEEEVSAFMMAAIQSKQGKRIKPEGIISSAGIGRLS